MSPSTDTILTADERAEDLQARIASLPTMPTSDRRNLQPLRERASETLLPRPRTRSRQTVRFIDLFAGIGGLRLGFERGARQAGLTPKCVFASEWNEHARQTYQ